MLRLKVIAASNRQPTWVDSGYAEYADRLRGSCKLELIVVPLARRTQSSPIERALADEGERMASAIPAGAHAVALTQSGKPWTTEELAAKLASWAERGAPVALLIGGPDGLGAAALERAVEHWSLSPLTLPHGLARVVAAEAIYRAWSVLHNHPYHRASPRG
jgi:23S rRNA (pseudouridine1915-N3)-methyltransferase